MKRLREEYKHHYGAEVTDDLFFLGLPVVEKEDAKTLEWQP
jgi:hypothetical protein